MFANGSPADTVANALLRKANFLSLEETGRDDVEFTRMIALEK